MSERIIRMIIKDFHLKNICMVPTSYYRSIVLSLQQQIDPFFIIGEKHLWLFLNNFRKRLRIFKLNLTLIFNQLSLKWKINSGKPARSLLARWHTDQIRFAYSLKKLLTLGISKVTGSSIFEKLFISDSCH